MFVRCTEITYFFTPTMMHVACGLDECIKKLQIMYFLFFWLSTNVSRVINNPTSSKILNCEKNI